MYTVHIVHSHKTFDDGAYTYCHKEYGHSIGRMVILIGCILYTVYWYSVYCIHSHRACIHGTYGSTNSNANGHSNYVKLNVINVAVQNVAVRIATFVA